jgi:hypothetical protein
VTDAETSRTIDLPIPLTAEERAQERLTRWDRWYSTLPPDLRRKLSLHDFKRLGDCFRQAFGVGEVRAPPGPLMPYQHQKDDPP